MPRDRSRRRRRRSLCNLPGRSAKPDVPLLGDEVRPSVSRRFFRRYYHAILLRCVAAADKISSRGRLSSARARASAWIANRIRRRRRPAGKRVQRAKYGTGLAASLRPSRLLLHSVRSSERNLYCALALTTRARVTGANRARVDRTVMIPRRVPRGGVAAREM